MLINEQVPLRVIAVAHGDSENDVLAIIMFIYIRIERIDNLIIL